MPRRPQPPTATVRSKAAARSSDGSQAAVARSRLPSSLKREPAAAITGSIAFPAPARPEARVAVDAVLVRADARLRANRGRHVNLTR